MYPYKLTKPSLLWFPPSSRVLPKLVNEPPSVHPLQDFPFVVISAGGEGRASGCQSEFNARPSEGNTGHKRLRGCHINTPQVWQRVRKWMADMNSSRSGATREISSFCLLLNFLENMHLCDLLSVRTADLQASSCSRGGRWCRGVGSRRGTKRFIKFAVLFFCRPVASFCHFIPCLCRADDSCPASPPPGTCRVFGRIKHYDF